MLEDWLKPNSVNLFLRDHLCKHRPFAKPATAQNSAWIFQWNTLDRLLGNSATDTLVISRGKLVDRPTPRNLSETRALFADGIGLVIRHGERLDCALADFGRSLTETIRGEAHIQLFVTPGATYGFSWHYDREEVFIIQTAGIKDYFFRENTIENSETARLDFSRFREEVSPIGSVRLIEGDWLYIPSPWWHVAKCVEDSLSISVGISPDRFWLAELARKTESKR